MKDGTSLEGRAQLTSSSETAGSGEELKDLVQPATQNLPDKTPYTI